MVTLRQQPEQPARAGSDGENRRTLQALWSVPGLERPCALLPNKGVPELSVEEAEGKLQPQEGSRMRCRYCHGQVYRRGHRGDTPLLRCMNAGCGARFSLKAMRRADLRLSMPDVWLSSRFFSPDDPHRASVPRVPGRWSRTGYAQATHGTAISFPLYGAAGHRWGQAPPPRWEETWRLS